MQLFTVILLAAAASAATLPAGSGSVIFDPKHIFGRATNPCNSDNCVRAVQGTSKGPAQVAIAKADCGKFFEQTSIVPSSTATVTQTATVTKAPAWANVGQRDVPAKTVPAYASACSGAVRYSAACSCWGITATTTTITSGVATVTNTATVTTTASCNTAEPAGSIPTALGNALRAAGPAPASSGQYPIHFGFSYPIEGLPASIEYQSPSQGVFTDKFVLYTVPNLKTGYLYHVPSGLCATVYQKSSESPLFNDAPITLEVCETCAIAPPLNQAFQISGQSDSGLSTCVTFRGDATMNQFYTLPFDLPSGSQYLAKMQYGGGACIFLQE
ncbi:hypothetical protein VTL71DRAFT_1287 [Oculimacula yallundae]|uniref:Uncharacterized protein n=1 Tax=Oculimacula yallundae TaxID=86028 RepID=A0ABR4CCN9_9HELO